MALAVIETRKEQDFSVTGVKAGLLCSHTFIDCTLVIPGTDETLTMAMQVCTKIEELKRALSARLGFIEPDSLVLVTKQGCTFKKMQNSDQVLRRMCVRGIQSFKPPLHKYEHPYGVIGAGYNGIKTALFLLKDGQRDFIMFDRYDKIGGHCWLESANKTTRLQTEFASYHVWYGTHWSSEGVKECGGPPKDWEIWPTRDRILEHFELCARDYGIHSHCSLGVDVQTVDLVGKPNDTDRSFQFTCQPVLPNRKDVQGGEKLAHQKQENQSSDGYAGGFKRDKSKDPYLFTCSCYCMWPGNLTNPRQVTYSGEETFGGFVEYGVEMRCDYNNVTGQKVMIHGHGAFTMENIRTCCEYGAQHIWVVCRKRNLTCPRVVSWFINQSNPAITGAHCLNMLQKAYKYCNYDPWDMHSVNANPLRTTAAFQQKTRFGIGDIYFLACAYGLMEIVVDEVKRCSPGTVHMASGEKIEPDCILKCLGMLPDWTVDRVCKIKFLRGMWINGDPRRFTCADPDGIFASNFGGTTIGPAALGWVKLMKHVWDCPNEWKELDDAGYLDTLPIKYANEPEPDTPAYFINARHANGASFTFTIASATLQEKSANDSAYKHWVVNYCTPAEKIIEAAKKEWDDYEQSFRDKGMVPKDAPYIEYPYTVEYIEQQHKVHKEEVEAIAAKRR